MRLLKRGLALLIFLLVVQLATAQPINPVVDSLIHLITTESYRSHFDSLRTLATNNRKVTETTVQSRDHDACRNYIYKRFCEYLGNENSYLHHFVSDDYGGLCNVVGFKKGTMPWKGVLIVCAHYDSNNNRDSNSDFEKISPGANDNGTGVAAILEIARVLAHVETEQSVLFAAWDLEEVFTNMLPTGSNEWYVTHVKKRLVTDWDKTGKGGKIGFDDVSTVINFDMFGNPNSKNFNKKELCIYYGNNLHRDFATQYAETVTRYVEDIKAINSGKLILSDHYTFASREIPALVNLESGYKDDLFYHTASDYFPRGQNIDFLFASKVAQGGLAFLLENCGGSFLKKLPIEKVILTELANAYRVEHVPTDAMLKVFDAFGNCVLHRQVSTDFHIVPAFDGLYHISVITAEGGKSTSFNLNKKEGPSFESPYNSY